MGDFSTRLTATALRLLTQYGQAVTWQRYVTGEFNPLTGEVAIDEILTEEFVGYPSNYNISQVDGTTIQQDDILLIVSMDTIPAVDDWFIFNGYGYTILNVQRITAQGNNVVYKCQLRQ